MVGSRPRVRQREVGEERFSKWGERHAAKVAEKSEAAAKAKEDSALPSLFPTDPPK